MRLNIRYDDNQRRESNGREQELCNVDFYLNTRDDLVIAQNLINALLSVLPTAKDAFDAKRIND